MHRFRIASLCASHYWMRDVLRCLVCMTSVMSDDVEARCHMRFQHAFTACFCVFKVVTLIGSNHHNFCQNATACSTRMLQRVSQLCFSIHAVYAVSLQSSGSFEMRGKFLNLKTHSTFIYFDG